MIAPVSLLIGAGQRRHRLDRPRRFRLRADRHRIGPGRGNQAETGRTKGRTEIALSRNIDGNA